MGQPIVRAPTGKNVWAIDRSGRGHRIVRVLSGGSKNTVVEIDGYSKKTVDTADILPYGCTIPGDLGPP